MAPPQFSHCAFIYFFKFHPRSVHARCGPQGRCTPAKAGEETHQKEERRVYGAEWEADSGESQQSVCCKYLKFLFHLILRVFCWSVTLSFFLFRAYVFYKKSEVAVVLTSVFRLISSQRPCFCHFLWDHRRSECSFWIFKLRHGDLM